MKKTTLIAAISFLLTLPTLAQVPDIKPATSSDTGDARVAALGQDGVVVTSEAAVSPREAVQDMRNHGQTGQIAPLMRDGDRLVLEPLVNRVGIDSGSLVETVPASK
ncbi:hypothetical protein [Hyphomonas sp.]|uniref:hypothetical protein n=1 Tax=Hyphomonas sp. TaxID=87 RepID=UPI0032EC9D44|tara:strand:+ start:24350 stop:24670 length:321 start_codon:yes stop_codon:yes gene_type:complete